MASARPRPLLLLAVAAVALLCLGLLPSRAHAQAACSSKDPAPRAGPCPCSPGGTPYILYPQATYLTKKYGLNLYSNYGWWFNWNCKAGWFKGWGSGGTLNLDGQVYQKSCEFLYALPTAPAGYREEIDCKTDHTCPGESGCLGIQCFGSQWLSAQGYDGMMRGWADCANNPLACGPPYNVKWRFDPPKALQGPYMNPKTPCPEPPYTAATAFP